MFPPPGVYVTRTPALLDPSTSPANTIDVCQTGIVPDLQGPMHVILGDYLALIDMLCTHPYDHELGKRHIRQAVSAAAKGFLPTEYAAFSEDDKDEVVREVLDGQLCFSILGEKLRAHRGCCPPSLDR